MHHPIDPFTPAVELAAAIRRKEVSPVEVADSYLERMDELDPRLNAFCHRADHDVRKAAAAAADAVVQAASAEELPPFHGVPLPIKDLLDVAGWPTTHGSAGADRAPAAASDPVVRRFVDAGFVLLGKTTTSEFGTVSFTESEALGISRNPWDPDRTPGGSSSGAGVAVAAGMVPIAHAADGGGSIRVPASCTGLVGLKPTRGLVTNATVGSEGLATDGVLTRSVADTAAALDVLARHDPAAWWSPPTPRRSFADAMTTAPPRGLRIGVLVAPPLDGLNVDPACVAAVDKTLRTLESAGHHVVDVPLPLPPAEELVTAFTTIWNVGGAGVPLADPDRVEPHNRALRDAARAIDSWAYAEGVQKTQRLSRHIVEAFITSFDLLVTPTMACLPPPVGFWRSGSGDDPLTPLLKSYPLAVFTSLFNVTGQPTISVPLHHDDATGLPVGVQLVAAPWREDLLLQVSHTLELAHPWTDRRPAVS
ncbi:amidase [Streptomyces sp. ISL-22]|uniref:amidase n=1 Tax=unclassified Streptomyces TaxID=2593676 RepID=UPI001BECA2E9|nr:MULTISPECIES: amidase [unclassified Streptomyces]MBT2419025.1 amidase [Streptomyces sp. ISL-24]MBT2437690.1 amidase [Streptomyces sp. ISL-22]